MKENQKLFLIAAIFLNGITILEVSAKCLPGMNNSRTRTEVKGTEASEVVSRLTKKMKTFLCVFNMRATSPCLILHLIPNYRDGISEPILMEQL